MTIELIKLDKEVGTEEIIDGIKISIMSHMD